MDVENSVVLNLMKYCIVAVALVLAYVETRRAISMRGTGYGWIFWSLSFIGVYWAFYYTQSILGGLIPAHQVWVRSPLLITLALVAAGAIMSLRNIKK